MLEVFDEPVRTGDEHASTQASRLPGQRFHPLGHGKATAPPPPQKPAAAPLKGLISAVIGISLVPTALLIAIMWQGVQLPRDTQEGPLAKQARALPQPGVSAQPKQASRPLEAALSSPERIDAAAGEIVEFPVAIDATEALPARTVVAVTELPEAAFFSAGRPYGKSGWSLRPDEITDLRLHLPPVNAAAEMHLELVAGDGTVLARSATQLAVAALPPAVAKVDIPETFPTENASLQPSADVQETGAIAAAMPPPERKPRSPVADEPEVKVTTVKVVSIEPPRRTRPYDGAYGLGSPADAAPAEWMETKTAVDMHAKAEQSSETVKVAQGGIRVRVLARDKRWIQVTDPATATTGWIYDRFLKPADPPAQ